MATKKKTARKKTSRKKTQKKNYLPTYIISSMVITILLAIFMYIDYGEGGVVNKAVKNAFCGLFGVCGFFVPLIMAGATAYLVKFKNIKRFWGKLGLLFLALVDVSALVNMPQNNPADIAFYLGYENYEGGGFLGACVSEFMKNMVQEIASYIILSILLIVLASFITHIPIFTAAAKWLKTVIDEARAKYVEVKDEHCRRAEERAANEDYAEEYEEITDDDSSASGGILDAANSFARDTESKGKRKTRKKSEPKEKPEINANEAADKKADKKKESDDFSNGIDDIFGHIEDEDIKPAQNEADTQSKTEEVPEKADKISDKEKEEYNSEFNKAIEQPTVEYVFPPITLLDEPKAISGDKREEMRRTAEKLISVLDNFGVKAKLSQVTQGPTVTRYEIQLDTGVKLSKIVGLADDIALNLAVSTVLVAPVPGKAAVGVEIPNNKVSSVSIREMLTSDAFKRAKSKLTFALGKDIGGNVVVGDIAKMPHLLIAGATGSGKSVCINTIIMSILYKAKPEDVKLIMVDPKRVELGVYNGIPHLLVPVVTDPKKAAGALNWAVTEMMRRYDLFTETGVRQLESYNKLMEKEGGEKVPQLVIIIDELADLMMVAAKEVEDYIVRLTQLARAAGIYLVIATQRPSVDVITGLIKANVPSRIALAVSSQVDSRTIIDKGGAEKLLGKGDMLYHPAGARNSARVQGAFVTDAEIEAVVNYIKENVGVTHYSEDLAEEIEHRATGENGVTPDVEDDGDALLPEAIELALSLGKISTSMVQRRLGVGYSRAGRIIDQMEARGIISGANGSKPREVLISHADMPANGNEGYDEE
ncbi:MAG: DNA translocase FtsK [Oscillospiraceae bacterium]|nr:DNA translocase FtsK [Oscillospiraceae bacterium]